MAHVSLAVPNPLPPINGITPINQGVTRLPRRNTKEAIQKRVTELMLPDPVGHVLYDIQNRLFQVKALFASVYALAESNDDSSDVRYALEAALALFEPIIESLETGCLSRTAAKWEMAHG